MASFKEMEVGTDEYEKRLMWIEKTCEHYAGNNMAKLKRIINYKMQSFDISSSDQNYNEFLSIANWQLYKILMSFDPDKNDSVEGYLIAKMSLKMNMAMKYITRDKDTNYERDQNGKKVLDEDGNRIVIQNVSLDNCYDCGVPISETIGSDFDVYEEAFGEECSDAYYEYLKRLGKKQRRVAIKIGEGYTQVEIAAILHMTMREVQDCVSEMKESKNVSVFYRR